MRVFGKWLAYALVITRCQASTDTSQIPLHEQISDNIDVHRVAIIGAGAAGSSTAYHLAQLHNESGSEVKLDITIFEQSHMIGGRTTTINALDDARYPTEVGASIFVQINHILYNATRDFDLQVKESSAWSTGSQFELGVWDGKEMVFTLSNDDDNGGALKGRLRGLLDIAKLFWKYGWSPLKTKRLSKTAVDRFLRLYHDYFPWKSLDEAVAAVDLEEFTSVTGQQLLSDAGISEKFSRDLVQASTRVNYGQNLNSIHGLETMVCMAIEGAMAIQGGNWQIFNEMVTRSGADVHFNTTVSSITRTEDNTCLVSTNTSTSESRYEFDTVVLAAPYQFANISFYPALTSPPKKIDYVILYVTLFTSPHRPSPAYFGLDSQDQIPDTILTTLPPDTEQAGPKRGRGSVGATEFWSLSTLRVLEPSLDEYPESSPSSPPTVTNIIERQYLYKIFSPKPITATLLAQIFDLDYLPSTTTANSSSTNDPITLLSPHDITWSHLRTWSSYPYLPPTTSFEPFNLNGSHNLWYTSGIESFISTMETAALSGRNVARLIWEGIEDRKSREVEGTDG